MNMALLVMALGMLSAGDVQVSQSVEPKFKLEISTGVRYPDGSVDSSGKPRWARPRAGTWRDLVPGETIRMATFMAGPTCGFITGSEEVSRSATFGWRLEATPVSLTDDHAVVRVRWTREIVGGKASGEEPSEMLMLFRPGEVVPVDSTMLKNAPPAQCKGVLATLFVGLKEAEPYRERVVSSDLWLVLRQPDGREISQQLNVRGGFNQQMPFWFDDVIVGGQTLDVHGELTPRSSADGSIRLEFSAARRWSRGAEFPDTLVLGNGETVLTLKPDDVTSITIPLTGANRYLIGGPDSVNIRVKPDALDRYSLSIRVRSRQIR